MCLFVDLVKEVFPFSLSLSFSLSRTHTHTSMRISLCGNNINVIMNVAGALTLASVLLYPKTLGGGAIFSGWVPFNSSSIIERITPEAKMVCLI